MSGITLIIGAGLAFALVDHTTAHRRKQRSHPSSQLTPSAPRSHSLYPPRAIPFSLRFAVGPMVGQSDHAFRMLTRRYGATVAYTPMLYSAHFKDAIYRNRVIDFDTATTPTAVHDRPLIVQFAANDPQQLLFAAQYVEHMCDAIDINLGYDH